jgi:hypothetical protein
MLRLKMWELNCFCIETYYIYMYIYIYIYKFCIFETKVYWKLIAQIDYDTLNT